MPDRSYAPRVNVVPPGEVAGGAGKLVGVVLRTAAIVVVAAAALLVADAVAPASVGAATCGPAPRWTGRRHRGRRPRRRHPEHPVCARREPWDRSRRDAKRRALGPPRWRVRLRDRRPPGDGVRQPIRRRVGLLAVLACVARRCVEVLPGRRRRLPAPRTLRGRGVGLVILVIVRHPAACRCSGAHLRGTGDCGPDDSGTDSTALRSGGDLPTGAVPARRWSAGLRCRVRGSAGSGQTWRR